MNFDKIKTHIFGEKTIGIYSTEETKQKWN